MIFSDECSVERGSGQRRSWVWCRPADRYQIDKVDTYGKGKDIRIMVWAAIWGNDRSELYVINRDDQSPRGGYSRLSFIDALQQNLPTIWQPSMLYQMDNASIYTASESLKWLEDQGIPLLRIPPNSPDLAPIENCWWFLKDYLYQHYPELLEGGASKAHVDHFRDVLLTSWREVGARKIRACIESMRARCQAIIAAGGWHTKY